MPYINENKSPNMPQSPKNPDRPVSPLPSEKKDPLFHGAPSISTDRFIEKNPELQKDLVSKLHLSSAEIKAMQERMHGRFGAIIEKNKVKTSLDYEDRDQQRKMKEGKITPEEMNKIKKENDILRKNMGI